MARAAVMKVEAPPSRYRVVERGRRLEVIDTWAAHQQPRAAESGLRRLDFSGSAALTTRPFYDLKGPRTLALDPGSAALVRYAKLALAGIVLAFVLVALWQPGVLVLVALLFQPRLWKGARTRITGWLDRFGPA